MKMKLGRSVMLSLAVMLGMASLSVSMLYARDIQMTGALFPRILQKWDTNRDGRLDPSEWKGNRPFCEVDVNGDGVINEEDFASTEANATPAGRFERLLSAWDTNRDGKIAPEEWKSEKDFKPFDRNHDGFISIADFSRATTADNTPDTPSQKGHPLMNALDLNKDGRISYAEWDKTKGNFGDFDKNIDGYVTPDEL